MSAPSRTPGARAFYYDAHGRDRELPLDEVDPKQLREDNLLWIDVAEPVDETLAHLQKILDLPADTLRAPISQPPELKITVPIIDLL